MAELALISALIHRGGQKAMCDNDCRTTYNTNNTRALTLTHTAWRHVWTLCQKCLHIPWWRDRRE